MIPKREWKKFINYADMAERLIASDLKSEIRDERIVGSNPTICAKGK